MGFGGADEILTALVCTHSSISTPHLGLESLRVYCKGDMGWREWGQGEGPGLGSRPSKQALTF